MNKNPKCGEDPIIEPFKPEGFWYDEQIKKYIAQAMVIFSDLYVETGVRRSGKKEYIDVPVYYGSMDRVSAWFLSDSTQNKPVKVPAISVFMDALDVAPSRYKGNDFISRHTHMKVGGVYPDDVQTIERYMPVPYDMRLQVGIIVSNTDQQFQILEQILPLFNPSIQIQTTDEPYDWESITQVNLDQIGIEETYPSGIDPRVISIPLYFTIPIYLRVEHTYKDNFVEKLKIRILNDRHGVEELIKTIEIAGTETS